MKTHEQRLARKFATLNRRTVRRCLKEAADQQKSAARFAEAARWNYTAGLTAPAEFQADYWDRAGMWQGCAANCAKWAMKHLTQAQETETDETKLLGEATAALARVA